MGKPRRQHYLPSVYMKHFSSRGQPQGRSTHIFYSDGTKSQDDRTVNGLSWDSYHYSRDQAQDVEGFLKEIEDDYGIIVEKVLRGDKLTKKNYFGMVLAMIEFHARNPSYENLTHEENYEAYQIVSRGMMKEIFGELAIVGKDMENMYDFIRKNWKLMRISAKGDKFISSDHPSLFFSVNGEIAFIFLPISSKYGLIAADTRKVNIIADNASLEDVARLNGLQALRCINYVYSEHDQSEFIGTGKELTEIMMKDKPRGFVSKDCWLPEYINYEKSKKLCFVSIV